MKRIFLTLLICLPICINAQNITHCIWFYRPYTGNTETNLYTKPIPKFNFTVQYTDLKKANVKKELNNAFIHHDYRFMSISGFSYLYPGLEGGYKKNAKGIKEFVYLTKKNEIYIDKYKFKVIEGTSDAISANLPPLQSVAYDFAKQYNKMLLARITDIEAKEIKEHH